MKHILREITPLDRSNLFYATYYPDNPMDFPLHFHDDFELNLTLNVPGSRIIGNRVDHFTSIDLALMGPDVLHCYKRDEAAPDVKCEVVVIQFRNDFHHSEIFSTKELQAIKNMLDKAGTGIIFSPATATALRDRLRGLSLMKDFGAVTEFLAILHELAVSPSQQIISPMSSLSAGIGMQQSRRINKILHFVEMNYREKISLEDVGNLVGMSPSSVSRFFKGKTKQRFWDYLNNYRVDRAARLMGETSHAISEICFECGFHNISNFNRVFRERTGSTPSQYRKRFRVSMIPNEEAAGIMRTARHDPAAAPSPSPASTPALAAASTTAPAPAHSTPVSASGSAPA